MHKGHGDDIDRYPAIRLNFSSNVYSPFSHKRLFEYLASRMGDSLHYPSCDDATTVKRLAGLLGVSPGNLLITSGATEAIYLLALYSRRNRSAILQPTFSEYFDACTIHEHRIRNIYGISMIPADADVVWLCNPNNPTGTVIDHEILAETIARNSDKLFVIDNSYRAFTVKPIATYRQLLEMGNVVSINSSTKRFAIPGIRLGFAVGQEHLIERLRNLQMPWSVGTVAQAALAYLAEHHNDDDFALDLPALMAERERVAKALTDSGIVDVWDSDCHILLCRLRNGRASALKEWLANEKGILIRDASNFSGLDNSYFRIAVQQKDANDALIEAIRRFA